MDTKLKKWKGAISFICVSLSVLLLIAGVSAIPYVMSNWDSVLLIVKNISKTSYLESSYVDNIVVDSLNQSFMYKKDTVKDGYYLNELANDKNMYIEVRRDNKVIIKSSHTDFDNLGIDTKLSEEYSSLYSFRNGVLKHRLGEEIVDIYGDNIYDSGELRVPGYSNYTANSNQLEVEVLLAFKTNPIMYVANNSYPFASSNIIVGGTSTEAALYEDVGGISTFVEQGYYYDNYHAPTYQAKIMHDRTKIVVTGLIVGITLLLGMLVLGCVFYPHKKLVDAFIAKLIKYIPFEFKLFCICVTVAFCISAVLYYGFDYFWFNGEVLFMIPLTAIVIWLLANDNKYNKPLYKQSVIYVLYSIIAQPNVRKGVYRKLIRLIILACTALVIGMACGIIFLMAVFWRALLQAIVFFTIGAAMCAVIFFSAKEIISICKNTGKLLDYLQQLSKGEEVPAPTFKGCIELDAATQQLNDLEQSLQGSIARQMKSERMKIELIANVSHDIKTPLTSVISYIDLLKEEAELPQHVKEYIVILDQKSQRLKNMVQDIFEVSKATSGQLPVNTVRLDLCRLLRQTLADAQDNIVSSGMTISESLPAEPCDVMADGDRMYRVYQNLVSNALKYSLAGSRIHVNLEQKEGKAIVSVKNVSAVPIDDSVDFTQRFVRGDDSRTDGGSGLGLSIASSFTVACGGNFYVDINADMFSAYTEFKLL